MFYFIDNIILPSKIGTFLRSLSTCAVVYKMKYFNRFLQYIKYKYLYGKFFGFFDQFLKTGGKMFKYYKRLNDVSRFENHDISYIFAVKTMICGYVTYLRQ